MIDDPATDSEPNSFPPIADYGFLSDCENSCLVAPDGAVEWLCLPGPTRPACSVRSSTGRPGTSGSGRTATEVPHDRRYIPGTMALETTWHTPSGWLVVRDVLTVEPTQDDAARRTDFRGPGGRRTFGGVLLRIATCIEGHVEVVATIVPVFEYGAQTGSWSYDGDGYDVHVGVPTRGRPHLAVTSSFGLGARPAPAVTDAPPSPRESPPSSRSRGRTPPGQDLTEAQAQLDDTVTYWRDWLSNGTFPDHPWRIYMERSALTLKGLSYAPTGAIMAAATTSLPETPGGARNWDYRYTWIRDSSFMLRSLYRLGFAWEAMEYFAFVLEAVAPRDAAVTGISRSCTASTAARTSPSRPSTTCPAGGTRGPVRIGNGAWDQHQNDVWGMLLDAVDIHLRQGASQIVHPVWEGLARPGDTAISHAGEPDQGIWEIRGDPQHFTASKVLCWVAMDRGADLARADATTDRAEQWRKAADDLKPRSSTRASAPAGASASTTGQRGSSTRRCSLIPILGFLPPDDERVRATVLAIADELTEDGLVLRYKVDTTDTGLRGQGGARSPSAPSGW